MIRSLSRVISLVIAAIFAMALACAPFLASAQMTHNYIGLSPSSIVIDGALRDQTITKTVNLQRDLTDLPLTLSASFAGPDGRFLSGPSEVFFDVGVRQVSYTFEIIPTAAAVGDYEAQIQFVPTETSGEGVGGTGFAILRGVALRLNFSVTDEQVLSYEVLRTSFQQTEERLPAYFEFEVDNTGNVEWRPERVVFAFSDQYTGEDVDEVTLEADAFEFAQPSNTSLLSTEFDHGLSPGSYEVQIYFYEGDEIAHIERNSFMVFEEGTLAQEGRLVEVSTNKDTYAGGEKIQLTATFENTGDLATNGTLISEVFSQETNELVDILTSSERTVAAGQTFEFDQVIELPEAGVYTVSSYIEYAGTKVTDSLDTIVTVQTSIFLQSGTGQILLVSVGGLLILIGLVVIIVLIAKRKKKKKEPVPASVAPAMPSEEKKQQDRGQRDSVTGRKEQKIEEQPVEQEMSKQSERPVAQQVSVQPKVDGQVENEVAVEQRSGQMEVSSQNQKTEPEAPAKQEAKESTESSEQKPVEKMTSQKMTAATGTPTEEEKVVEQSDQEDIFSSDKGDSQTKKTVEEQGDKTKSKTDRKEVSEQKKKTELQSKKNGGDEPRSKPQTKNGPEKIEEETSAEDEGDWKISL